MRDFLFYFSFLFYKFFSEKDRGTLSFIENHIGDSEKLISLKFLLILW